MIVSTKCIKVLDEDGDTLFIDGSDFDDEGYVLITVNGNNTVYLCRDDLAEVITTLTAIRDEED